MPAMTCTGCGITLDCESAAGEILCPDCGAELIEICNGDGRNGKICDGCADTTNCIYEFENQQQEVVK